MLTIDPNFGHPSSSWAVGKGKSVLQGEWMMENWQNWIVFWLERLVILKKKGSGSKLHSQHVLMVTHYSRSCWMLTFFFVIFVA